MLFDFSIVRKQFAKINKRKRIKREAEK